VKALIQTDYGDPARVLELHDDVPEPVAGAGQVVIDIEAAVVQAADARTVLGAEGFRKKLPRTPGYEGVGRICELGSGVKGIDIGTRVFAPIGAGTYRERVAVSAEGLTLAPEGDPVQVALLSLSPATALLILHDFAKLAPDDWVLQNAANSPVGRMIIQMAREQRIRVVNVVKSSPVISELKDIGAGAVLLDPPALKDRVTAVTQGAPIRMAVDAIAGAATARLAACLADDGVIVNYGAMSGEPCHLPSEMLATRGIRLCGITPARQLLRHTPEERKAVYERIGEMLAAGRLQARVAATYELSEAINAIRHAMQIGDKRHGKVVVRLKHLQPPEPADAPAATTAPPADSSVAAVAADSAATSAESASAPAPAPAPVSA
jgi:NADPH:quinone reductase-like Zn-dependent oxidoreductase